MNLFVPHHFKQNRKRKQHLLKYLEKPNIREMPLIRPGMRKPPPGFDLIRPELERYDSQMKDILFSSSRTEEGATTEESATTQQGRGGAGRVMRQSLAAQKRKGVWDMSKVQYQRTRYVYDAYRAGTISESCFQYCCEMALIDKPLTKLWAVQGYETVCCAACVTPSNFNGASSCRCRVPGKKGSNRTSSGSLLGEERCLTCGCDGCASGGLSGSRKRARDAELPSTADGSGDADPTGSADERKEGSTYSKQESPDVEIHSTES